MWVAMYWPILKPFRLLAINWSYLYSFSNPKLESFFQRKDRTLKISKSSPGNIPRPFIIKVCFYIPYLTNIHVIYPEVHAAKRLNIGKFPYLGFWAIVILSQKLDNF